LVDPVEGKVGEVEEDFGFLAVGGEFFGVTGVSGEGWTGSGGCDIP